MASAKMRKIWIITALCIAGAGILAALVGFLLAGWDFAALNSEETEMKVYNIGESFDNISVSDSVADVRILRSDDGRCRVETVRYDGTEYYVGVEDNVLAVVGMDDGAWYRRIGIFVTAPSVTVYLPEEQYASLTVKATSGSVSVSEELAFESAALSSSSGSIRSGARITDRLEANSTSGSVSAAGIEGASVRLESTSGSVTLSDSRPASAQLESTSGRILLREVTVSGELSASNTSGSVRLDNCDAANIYVRSSSGSVSGTLLSGKNFTADSSSGSVRVPASSGEGVCEVRTSSGSIRLEVRE